MAKHAPICSKYERYFDKILKRTNVIITCYFEIPPMRNNLRSTYAVLFINSGKAKIPLSPTAERIDRGAATIPPNGMAMVAVGDDQMVMDIRYLAICFQIHPLQHGGTLHIYPEDSFVVI